MSEVRKIIIIEFELKSCGFRWRLRLKKKSHNDTSVFPDAFSHFSQEYLSNI